MQRLSAQLARVRARKEDKACCDLRWLSWPTHWACERLLCAFVHSRWDEWCPDWTWRHRVYADAFVHELIRQATSEADDGTLRAGVVQQIRSADVGVDGCVVDDCVALLHVW